MPIVKDYNLVGRVLTLQLRFVCDGFHDPLDPPSITPEDERGTLFQHGLAILYGWNDNSTMDKSEVFCPECAGRKCAPFTRFLEFLEMRPNQLSAPQRDAMRQQITRTRGVTRRRLERQWEALNYYWTHKGG